MVTKMRSLRDAFVPDLSTISVRKILIEQWQLPSPLSLANIVSPEQHTIRTEKIMEAGDVSGSAELTLSSDSWWNFRGLLYSSADIVGDNYSCLMVLNSAGFSVRADGNISPRTHAGWEQWGQSSLIVSNWENLKRDNFPYQWHFSTDPRSINWKEVIKVAGIILLALLPIILGSGKQQRDGDKILIRWANKHDVDEPEPP